MTGADALQRLCVLISQNYPQLTDGLLPYSPDADDLLPEATRVMDIFVRAGGGERLEQGAEAFATICFDFILRQARFLKTGHYAAEGQASQLVESLYANEEKMLGYYLDGLFLSYALWRNHALLYRFLCSEFLPRLGDARVIGEIGVGNGLMAATLLNSSLVERYVGVDIGSTVLAYAARLSSALGVASRFIPRKVDVSKPSEFDRLIAEERWDGLLCCEVLEHVAEPQRLLDGLAKLLRPGGVALITTVANLEAEDHVYLYQDAEHIRRHLRGTGFEISRELVAPVKGYEECGRPCLNYGAVVVRGQDE